MPPGPSPAWRYPNRPEAQRRQLCPHHCEGTSFRKGARNPDRKFREDTVLPELDREVRRANAVLRIMTIVMLLAIVQKGKLGQHCGVDICGLSQRPPMAPHS